MHTNVLLVCADAYICQELNLSVGEMNAANVSSLNPEVRSVI